MYISLNVEVRRYRGVFQITDLLHRYRNNFLLFFSKTHNLDVWHWINFFFVVGFISLFPLVCCYNWNFPFIDFTLSSALGSCAFKMFFFYSLWMMTLCCGLWRPQKSCLQNWGTLCNWVKETSVGSVAQAAVLICVFTQPFDFFCSFLVCCFI